MPAVVSVVVRSQLHVSGCQFRQLMCSVVVGRRTEGRVAGTTAGEVVGAVLGRGETAVSQVSEQGITKWVSHCIC